jgi:hypothetical protein
MKISQVGSELALVALLSAGLCQHAAAQQRGVNTRARRPVPVEARARQYWAKRADRDLQGAYAFYCSPYKSRVPLVEYLKLTRLVRFQLTDVRVTHATPVGDRMEVTVEYRFVAPSISAEPLRGETKDVWGRENGTWCKVDEPLILPFPSTNPPQPGRQ